MTGSKQRQRAASRSTLVGLVLAASATMASTASVQPEPANSPLDAPLFYQLLIGEIELQSGRAGNAYEVILDAARRHNDASLFRRAIDIALRARAGEQALAATRTWRSAQPSSTDALRYQTQILLALNRIDALADPLSAWLTLAPVVERPALIAAMPRLLQRANDRKQALAVLEKVLAPFIDRSEYRTASRVAIGRMALAAGDADRALALARAAAADDPSAPGPVLLALEMLPGRAPAEQIVIEHLARAQVHPGMRLAYVRALAQSQRLVDAIAQLDVVTREHPELPEPWLTLGALQIELKRVPESEAALKRYLELAEKSSAPAAETDERPPGHDTDDDTDAAAPTTAAAAPRDLTPAWLMLAQAAEMRGDTQAAESWLARVDNPQRALEVQARRATAIARQGQVARARELIQAAPERTGADARAKLLAESQMLRDVKQWGEAATVLSAASQRFPDDVDLVYELAMVEEKRSRFDDMERLLRRVIELKPDHSHAHNALGYSLADRNLRLGEARELIRKALELAPADPFIVDSLGWVEYRLGNHDEAARLLRQAWHARPDTEIGAHLGEVLWVMGRHDEARRIWLEVHGRDATNEVLRETLARLKVGL